MIKNNTGPDLWKKAKKIIPGGTQLLSKRCERFLPELWPAYYSKAKGCEVYDLDGNHYYDFAQMGVGSCVLGYADEDVNSRVIDIVGRGSMCTLNAPEEVELAEKLVELHPWAQKVRFAKTGGEACAIAVRIARVSTGKSKVAFCGYHGWHDWYLAANLADNASLDEQLLPGLAPKGVPRELQNTSLPFFYNNIKSLESLVSKHKSEIGVIIMEPERNSSPTDSFLHKVRQIASEIGAVLIFDEVTSGFRLNVGGIHLLRGVNPDIAVFGKGLGNGFPISAVIGLGDIMEQAQDSFISSTYWTDRVGFAAALATIEKMIIKNVPEKLNCYGELINEGWHNISSKHGIKMTISGIPPLTHISFNTPYALEAQTLYAQEMLKKGYLVGSSVYATYAYSKDIINSFIKASDEVFKIIKQALSKSDFSSFLVAPRIQSGFKRLT